MKKYIYTNLLILILFLSSGCQASPEIITPSPVKISTATIRVITPESSPTSTPEPSETPKPTETPTTIKTEFIYSDQDNTYYYTATGGKVVCNSTIQVNSSWLVTSKINGIDVVIGAYEPSTGMLRVYGFEPAVFSPNMEPSMVANRIESLLVYHLVGGKIPWEPNMITRYKMVITFGEGKPNDKGQELLAFADIRKTMSTPEYIAALKKYAATGVWDNKLPLLPRNITAGK